MMKELRDILMLCAFVIVGVLFWLAVVRWGMEGLW